MQRLLFFAFVILSLNLSAQVYSQDVETLMQQLDSPDPKVRKDAVYRLAVTGKQAAPWINKLIEALEDKDLSVAKSAGIGLSVLGPLAKDHAPKMVEKLKDKHGTRRFPEYSEHFQYVGSGVAIALGKMGSDASYVAPDIAEILRSSNPVARKNAEQALVRMGPSGGTAASKIAELLDHENPEFRMAAIRISRTLGKHFEKYATKLVPALRSDVKTANAAAGTFGYLKEHAAPALPELVKLLNDDERYTRLITLASMRGIGKKSAIYAKDVAEMVQDNGASVDIYVIEWFSAMGESAGAAAPRLAELLSADDEHTRQVAAMALGKLGKHAREHTPKLASCLNDRDSLLSYKAMKALQELGPNASPVADQVAKQLSVRSLTTRSGAARTLGSMGDAAKPYVSQIIQLLGSPNEHVMLSAKQALIDLGGVAADKTQELTKLFNHENIKVVLATVEVIKSFGSEAVKSAISDFEKLIEHDAPSVQLIAIDTVLQHGHVGTSVSQLMKLMHSKEQRISATKLIVRLPEKSLTEIIPTLFSQSQKEIVESVNQEAVLFHSMLGPSSVVLMALAKDREKHGLIEPKVVKLFEDKDPAARAVAVLLAASIDSSKKEPKFKDKILKLQETDKSRLVLRATQLALVFYYG